LGDFYESTGYSRRPAALREEPHSPSATPCGRRDSVTSPLDESCHNRETPGRGEADVPSARNLSYPGIRNQKTPIVESTTFEQNAAFISTINLLDLDSTFLPGELNYRQKLLISRITGIIDKRAIIRKAHSVPISLSSLDGNSSAVAGTIAVFD